MLHTVDVIRYSLHVIIITYKNSINWFSLCYFSFQGAIFGLVSSLALCFWMQIGAIFTLPAPTPLPLNISMCTNLTDSSSNVMHIYDVADSIGEAVTFSANYFANR